MGTVTRLFDGLANIMKGRGTSVDSTARNLWLPNYMTPQQIEAAYRGSWLMRKIVDTPAQDMVRAGRDWDCEDEDIEKIEEAECELHLWAKVLQAIILGRLGGGAIVMGLGDDASQPLPENIAPGALKYLTVLSRWQLTVGEEVLDPSDPLFGQPRYFMLSGASGSVTIHPSRVVAFKGLPVPQLISTSWEDRFWGDSVIQNVNEAVENAMTATAGFAALIDEAKIDIYRFAGLTEILSRGAEGDALMRSRVELTNSGKSIHRAVILDKEDEWEQRQLDLAGQPELIRTYLAIVAGAAEMPATKLLGKSADGMNATGEGDERNYLQTIAAKQCMDLRPALMKLDAVLLPSAGLDPKMPWKFSPLTTLSEKEEAEIENKEADSISKIVNTGLIPESAMAETVANRLIESGRFPGLKAKLDELGDWAEGMDTPDPNEADPSAMSQDPQNEQQQEGGDPSLAGGGKPKLPARRAANDAAPRTLYVQRKLLNADELIKWAKSQGFTSTLAASDMHVTITYSKTPVDWMKMGQSWQTADDGKLIVQAGGARLVEPLGDKGAVVLLFGSSELCWRHEEMVRNGASHDFPEYQPHVTITYDGAPSDLANVEPYRGRLEFGPEIFEELDEDWASKIEEA